MRWTLLLGLLLACTGDDAATVVASPLPSDAPTAVVVDCPAVALDACASTDGCAVVRGTPLETDVTGALCIGDAPSEPVACGPDIACPAVEVQATDPDGTPYLLPEGCLPAGWSSLSAAVAECPPDRGCGGVDLGACDGTSGCTLASGRPLSDVDTGVCIDYTVPLEPLACLADTGCGDLETVASAGPGATPYLFPDTCTPPGWTVETYPVEECTLACADTSLADCTASGCALIQGRALADDGAGGLCEDPAAVDVALACRDAGPCGDAITYASDGTTTWWFADTCTPPAYTLVAGPFATCAP
jgi:hypothetical protein